ncbi:MAG: hypothetical protein RSC00_00030 [Ruthenibacterium sp.]
MSMTVKYIIIQLVAFVAVLSAAALVLGFGLVPLLIALVVSVAVVSAVAVYDAKTGRYAIQGENLFSALTDEQLRECYDAYSALEHGGMSRSMLFYKLLTRYEDAADNGYDLAANDLLEEISSRWIQFEDFEKRVS